MEVALESTSQEGTMKFMKVILTLCVCSMALQTPRVFAQANMADLQAGVGTVLTVDANTGTDVNAGIGQPLKTLQAAVGQALTNSARGLATRVVISPGEYRESLDI